MAIFAQDSFTDTDGTNLADHVGEVGATWTKLTGFTGNATINSNTLINSTSESVYYASGSPSGPDYEVSADYSWENSVFANFSVLGRINTSTGDHYRLHYARSDAVFRLRKWVDGSLTTLASSAQSLIDESTFRTHKLVLSGSNLEGFADGVSRVSTSDASITAAGKAGVLLSGTTNPRLRIDNFLAEDETGGGPTAYEDSISLGLSSGISAASTAAANDAVAFGVSSGLGLLSVVSAGDAVSLGLSAGLTCGATAAAQDVLSIGVSSGLGTTGAAAAIDTLALGLAAGISNSGVAAALGAISVGIGLGLSISDAAAQQYSDTFGIGVGIGITAASTAAASDGFTLTLEAGLSAVGLAAARATITIGITSDVLAAAQASTFDAIQIGAALGTAIASSLGGAFPPASRTITVSAQGRAIQVQLQTRRIVV